MSAYADDVAVFCCDKESIEETVRITKEYCDATGAAVNYGKCCGFWHDNWTSKPLSFASIGWTSTPNTYLGVPLQYYRNSTLYWTEVLENSKWKAVTWVNRDKSIFTRATVRNIFLVAKLWYILQVLACKRINIPKFQSYCYIYMEIQLGEDAKRQRLPSRQVRGTGTHALGHQATSFTFLFSAISEPPVSAHCYSDKSG
ncbi:hypothetical protein ANAPC5_01427 [Anaplasma phagocytophilum]|nr:hypothetical protein ANAPC5_01427 [Anaplasma phagocytophilum]